MSSSSALQKRSLYLVHTVMFMVVSRVVSNGFVFAVAFTNLGNRKSKYIKCRYRFEIVGQISYCIELN